MSSRMSDTDFRNNLAIRFIVPWGYFAFNSNNHTYETHIALPNEKSPHIYESHSDNGNTNSNYLLS